MSEESRTRSRPPRRSHAPPGTHARTWSRRVPMAGHSTCQPTTLAVFEAEWTHLDDGLRLGFASSRSRLIGYALSLTTAVGRKEIANA